MTKRPSQRDEIGSVNEAYDIIDKLQHRVDRCQRDKILAQARVYDILYADKVEPSSVELKARIVYLDEELKKVIEERDKFKEAIRTLKESLK